MWYLEYEDEPNGFVHYVIKKNGQPLQFATHVEALAEARHRAYMRGYPYENYTAVKPQPAPVIYLIGSLRNLEVPLLANRLRAEGFEVFDDWFAAGPEADDYWMQYEKQRGHTFAQALNGYAANHVWEYDKSHLHRADAAILLMPAGKSGHLELGYFMGLGKPGYILMDKEPERYDVMYRFSSMVHTDEKALVKRLATDLCVSTAAQ